MSIIVGDIFDQDAHLVVGFTDTFDTDIADDRIINAETVQGQMLRRLYFANRHQLDRDLEHALRNTRSIRREKDKKQGKTLRYPIGTVAALGSSSRRIFAVAYSRMSNDLIARSDLQYIRLALDQIWESMLLYGRRERIAIPIIGSSFARITYLDRTDLLRLILMSFVVRSRKETLCRELVVVIHKDDRDKVDLVDAEHFLRSL